MSGLPTLVDGVLDIPPLDHYARLRLLNRLPADKSKPIKSFDLILETGSFHGETRTRANDEYSFDPPLSVFLGEVLRAGHVKGMWGPWQTPEGEFVLEVRHDGIGHYVLHVLLTGFVPHFTVRADVMVEAGQMPQLARLVAEFLGETKGYYTEGPS